MIDLPDFSSPLRRIAGSVDKLAGVPPEPDSTEPPAETEGHAAGAAKSEVQGHA
jgi:hypothetical protein